MYWGFCLNLYWQCTHSSIYKQNQLLCNSLYNQTVAAILWFCVALCLCLMNCMIVSNAPLLHIATLLYTPQKFLMIQRSKVLGCITLKPVCISYFSLEPDVLYHSCISLWILVSVRHWLHKVVGAGRPCLCLSDIHTVEWTMTCFMRLISLQFQSSSRKKILVESNAQSQWLSWILFYSPKTEIFEGTEDQNVNKSTTLITVCEWCHRYRCAKNV